MLCWGRAVGIARVGMRQCAVFNGFGNVHHAFSFSCTQRGRGRRRDKPFFLLHFMVHVINQNMESRKNMVQVLPVTGCS